MDSWDQAIKLCDYNDYNNFYNCETDTTKWQTTICISTCIAMHCTAIEQQILHLYNDKYLKWRALIILPTVSAYFIIFWIWPSKVLLTGLIKDCSKKCKLWIISMLGQSFLVFVLYFFDLYLSSWNLIFIRCIFGKYIIDRDIIDQYLEHYWWVIILMVLVPQIIVWRVAIIDTYR